MTGVKYNEVDYDLITDYTVGNPSNPATWQDYYDALVANYNRTNGQMKIDVTKNLSPSTNFTVDIYLDGGTTASYSNIDIALAEITTLAVQSHWGSGVVCSNMEITPK